MASRTRQVILQAGHKSEDHRPAAEGVGFEPTRPVAGPTGFQDRRLRPLGHPSDREYRRPVYNHLNRFEIPHCYPSKVARSPPTDISFRNRRIRR